MAAKSVSLGSELEKMLDDFCKTQGVSASDVIRVSFFQYLQNAEKPATLYELGHHLFGADKTPVEGSPAANYKNLLKDKLPAKHSH